MSFCFNSRNSRVDLSLPDYLSWSILIAIVTMLSFPQRIKCHIMNILLKPRNLIHWTFLPVTSPRELLWKYLSKMLVLFSLIYISLVKKSEFLALSGNVESELDSSHMVNPLWSPYFLKYLHSFLFDIPRNVWYFNG